MRTRIALTGLTLALLMACDEEPPFAEIDSADVISFEDYKRIYAQQLPDGSWLVERDIHLDDEEAVRAYYDALLRREQACEESDDCLRSAVLQDDGNDVVWSTTAKLNITYCIGDMGSVSNFNRVEAALETATREWETWADVNFIHLSAEDGSGCEPNTNGVLYEVRRDPECLLGDYLAYASFPNTSTRRVNYCDEGLAQNDAGLLETTLHELGHTLGLMHEHLRWEQDDEGCEAGAGWGRRNLTDPDEHSIMGYDHCNGMDGPNTTLSWGDRVGIGRLYNIARGHGRLSGNAFHQANSFLGNGVSDDIFWHVPGGSQYQLWTTSTSATIGFTKYTNNYSMGTYWRPLGVQWVSNGDGNYNREVLFFGPGTISDLLFVNENDGTFSTSSVSFNSFRIPLLGKFHGGTYTEVLWWWPGNSSLLWRTDGAGNITQTTANTTYVNGDPSGPLAFDAKVLTGNFGTGAANPTEILWYGGCYGWVTRGTGTSGFESYIVDMLFVTNTCSQDRQIPLLGNFDGDAKGDIFWYGPGSQSDRLVLNRGADLFDSYGLYQTDPHDLPVNGYYKPIVGDFNGDFKSDIFWYQQGTGNDYVWLFTGAGTYDNLLASPVNGDHAPIAGDFNNDGCDDIVWYETHNDRVFIWRSDCDGTFTSQATQAVPDRAYPVGYGIGY